MSKPRDRCCKPQNLPGNRKQPESVSYFCLDAKDTGNRNTWLSSHATMRTLVESPHGEGYLPIRLNWQRMHYRI